MSTARLTRSWPGIVLPIIAALILPGLAAAEDPPLSLTADQFSELLKQKDAGQANPLFVHPPALVHDAATMAMLPRLLAKRAADGTTELAVRFQDPAPSPAGQLSEDRIVYLEVPYPDHEHVDSYAYRLNKDGTYRQVDHLSATRKQIDISSLSTSGNQLIYRDAFGSTFRRVTLPIAESASDHPTDAVPPAKSDNVGDLTRELSGIQLGGLTGLTISGKIEALTAVHLQPFLDGAVGLGGGRLGIGAILLTDADQNWLHVSFAGNEADDCVNGGIALRTVYIRRWWPERQHDTAIFGMNYNRGDYWGLEAVTVIAGFSAIPGVYRDAERHANIWTLSYGLGF